MSSLESGSCVRIEAKEVLCGLVDLFGMNGTELAIRTGIAEIKRELSGLRLHLYGIGGRRREIDTRPSLGAKRSQGQYLRADHDHRRSDQCARSSRKALDLLVAWTVRESPDEETQESCAAMKQTPASNMVSDICSSISLP